ncbi:MAG: plastocyanin/azurin family copper-binding protein [Flavisolibacter sp.]
MKQTGGKTLMIFFISLLTSCRSTNKETITHKAYTVEIRQMQFQPAELHVQKGDTVIFRNEDMVAHDVTEAFTKSWTSGILPAGKSWRLVVSSSADYYCSIHQVMKGKISLP